VTFVVTVVVCVDWSFVKYRCREVAVELRRTVGGRKRSALNWLRARGASAQGCACPSKPASSDNDRPSCDVRFPRYVFLAAGAITRKSHKLRVLQTHIATVVPLIDSSGSP
jgi:hypothetical protein